MKFKLFLLSLLFSIKAISQVSTNYSFVAINEGYNPIQNGNAILIDDLLATKIPIGFNFEFNNQTFDSVCIAENGWVWFGDTNQYYGTDRPISTNSYNSPMNISGVISAFGSEIGVNYLAFHFNPEIRYELEGTAPFRVLKIQWKEYSRLSSMDFMDGDTLNFQIVLCETTNEIRLNYGVNAYHAFSGALDSVEVGLRGASRSDVFALTGNWNNLSSSNNYNSNIKISNSANGMPYDGLAIVFMPQQTNNPSLSLLSPNGGENYFVGDTLYIEWDADFVNNINIDLSTDGGQSYFNIANNVNTNQFEYKILAQQAWISNQARIKITSTQGNLSDISDANFSISAKNQGQPSIEITRPTQFFSIKEGETCFLEFEAKLVQNAQIDLFINDFNNSVNINNNLNTNPNGITNAHFQIPANLNADSATIIVKSNTNPLIADTLNFWFEIEKPSNNKPSLNLISPNGGELYFATEDSIHIIWDAEHIQNIKIEISFDEGITYSLISNNTQAALEELKIPININWVTNTARIKISDAQNNNLMDSSADNFIIAFPNQAQPEITISRPLQFFSIKPGEPVLLEFESENVQNVEVELFINQFSNGSIIFNNLATNTNGATNAHFLLPLSTLGDSACIVVRDKNDPNISDTLNFWFEIEALTNSSNTISKSLSYIVKSKSNELEIVFTETANGKISLLDMSGKLVFESTINSNLFTIPTIDLSKGIYVLVYANFNSTQTQKVIIK